MLDSYKVQSIPTVRNKLYRAFDSDKNIEVLGTHLRHPRSAIPELYSNLMRTNFNRLGNSTESFPICDGTENTRRDP